MADHDRTCTSLQKLNTTAYDIYVVCPNHTNIYFYEITQFIHYRFHIWHLFKMKSFVNGSTWLSGQVSASRSGGPDQFKPRL
jgi:hypothetical protein